jgi:hypothetical protein
MPRPEDERRGITHVLVELVSFDVELADFDQAKFDLLCLEMWQPFRAHWRSEPKANEFILSRYRDGVAALVAGSVPGAFRTATWTPDGVEISDAVDYQDYNHFLRLLAGYAERANFLSGPDRVHAEDRLGEVIDNPALAKAVLGAGSASARGTAASSSQSSRLSDKSRRG